MHLGRRVLVPLIAVFSLVVGAAGALAQLAAFPGAEGAGMFSAGGRGGNVYHVTSLADYDTGAMEAAIPGTLRYGLEEVAEEEEINNLTIVFDVGGQINLKKLLQAKRTHNVTIAGQTAPGGGITLAGNQFEVSKAHDVIVRYLRVRPGPGGEADAFRIVESNNVIADHISASWSNDEVFSATRSYDVTVQWSIISEALNGGSLGTAGNPSGHSYGSLINGGNITYHHNLYAHNRSRNPRPQYRDSTYTRLDFVNNVVYNPFDKFGYGEDDDHMSVNFVGNYEIAGPDTDPTTQYVFTSKTSNTILYQEDNILDLDKDTDLDDTVDAGWANFSGPHTKSAVRLDGSVAPPGFSVDPMPLVNAEPAEVALWSVLNGAGMTLWRDAVDLRIVNEVQTQGGNIRLSMSGVPDVAGEADQWPDLPGGPTLLDTDQDGMPDEYENMFAYLNPNNAADRNLDGNSNGYTDLEDYLNFLVGFPAPSDLFGDYNDDGVVDAADYAVWRDAMAAGAMMLTNRDPDNFGPVDEDDYATWRTNFGMTSGGGSTAAGAANLPVPEPSSLVLLVLGCVALANRRRTWSAHRAPMEGR
jgi:pectate lyase